MIIKSTEFTPPWLEGQADAPKFLLRVGDVIERGLMEAELAGVYRAGSVNAFELEEAIRQGVATLLADDEDLDAALALIDAEAQGEADTLTEQERQTLAGIRNVLADHWPPYRDLLAQAERRRSVAPLVAFRRYCTGLNMPGVTYERGKDDLVANSTMAAIDPFVLAVVGSRAFSMQYAGSQEKNLEPLSASEESQARINSDEQSPADGQSVPTDGKKTPGSPSRKKTPKRS